MMIKKRKKKAFCVGSAVVVLAWRKKQTHKQADAYPWVQLGWQGWHSLLVSAYLKMKLFAPCRPSGHFSTQLGPSFRCKHFTQ